jgi:hypothetical protein
MAHFAQLDENNNVVGMNVIDNWNMLDSEGNEQEALGIAYLTSLWGERIWKQCSYNNGIRKQYPGLGYSYDPTNDIFIAPQPYPSWNLDSNFDWQAPVAAPSFDLNTQYLNWNEETLLWEVIDLQQD